MQLTQWTDYALRVLLHCAACEGRSERVTISEIAELHAISRSHLMKIVQDLANRGFLETTRGRGGGMRLVKPAHEVTVGMVVRATETNFRVVECFDPETNQCRLIRRCSLIGVLDQAMQSFLSVLDAVTLADLTRNQAQAVALPTSRRSRSAPT